MKYISIGLVLLISAPSFSMDRARMGHASLPVLSIVGVLSLRGLEMSDQGHVARSLNQMPDQQEMVSHHGNKEVVNLLKKSVKKKEKRYHHQPSNFHKQPYR